MKNAKLINLVIPVLAVIAGLFIGSMANGLLIANSASIVPLPQGFDPNSEESLVNNIHLLKPENFIVPFLAHALGTLVSTFVMRLIYVKAKYFVALIMGSLFFFGGLYMVFLIKNSPLWFNFIDLVFAYFPMAYIGWYLASIIRKVRTSTVQ